VKSTSNFSVTDKTFFEANVHEELERRTDSGAWCELENVHDRRAVQFWTQ
jgi:hypothetical protein